jgi:hypothetical protein
MICSRAASGPGYELGLAQMFEPRRPVARPEQGSDQAFRGQRVDTGVPDRPEERIPVLGDGLEGRPDPHQPYSHLGFLGGKKSTCIDRFLEPEPFAGQV